ncbi:hypothetical protein SVIOM342S_10168 [Streptomyces violaceorubidus]
MVTSSVAIRFMPICMAVWCRSSSSTAPGSSAGSARRAASWSGFSSSSMVPVPIMVAVVW